MTIKKVNTKEEAMLCDELLNKLILSDKRFDDNINENFKVNDWYVKLYDKEDKIILIVKEDEKIVGYLYGYLSYDVTVINKVGFIDALYIEESSRNKGYATQLIKEFKDYCKNNNVSRLYINTYLKNIDALNLYKKEGFETISVKLECNL